MSMRATQTPRCGWREMSQRRLAIRILSEAVKAHCKGVAIYDTLQTAGGTQKVRMIGEPDLYRLIVGSKLETATKFEAWIFEEVLPSIRKHGAYMTEQTLERALNDPDFLIQLATKLKEEQEKRKQAEEEAQLMSQRLQIVEGTNGLIPAPSGH